MTDTFIQLAYLVAAFLFINALRVLGRPETARRGMQMAALGMLIAVVATLFHARIVEYQWIVVGIVAGAAIGYPLGMFVPMTAMPQRIAISHAFGALAATLVGLGEYHHGFTTNHLDSGHVAALALEVLLGGLTVTGSIMAAGKLQGWLPQKPITFPFQNISNFILLGIAVIGFVWMIIVPDAWPIFIVMLVVSLAIGVLIVLPIGGADMPVVVSLLNAYAGLAAVATGFALDNNILIIVGALDGASGIILSIAMSKAMNRSFANVLFGAFGSDSVAAAAGGGSTDGEMKPVSAEDAALRMAYAKRVVIVPGYGLAVSQAQHQVRELADLIEKRGGDVKFAIHPVAGRMPGHMNVLLAEAGVAYDKLIDMDEINEKFAETDVVLVIGANDVVNPAASTNPSSPIYGMPILKVSEAQSVIAMKRGPGKGFSGVENELFFDEKTSMLFGDAKQSLVELISQVKEA
ncbi:MAG: NAD(P)(+) transhydrogenase (Re/Si-specific) subunit beta [Devosia sp.]|jgi:NAD(P) transhydrogenase subunit beta|uniref:NAD(P)(+) transhydrogenase (Re/Si-specific) subunit beta n=1 Tax=unclassified Devosia TaxID=196773 RepID=UPI001A08C97C|nr:MULTISPECIES: NAD(P)(+) transhydrogenase (Re/Si-specific) subunit beta [unclassified Devosia]MBF0680601.1 NAD(P)(+) transhydrogenase (Re/Si-specific) subunit beta [Devosia sp.]WEJ34465.1 NAD(P)(+) transhydrogenase (Re/Si-specific) subunit beta [Devosia sp. SD17-2]